MRPVHSKEDVGAVCQEIVEHEGVAALTRRSVQAALRARAERLGHEPVEVDNGTAAAAIRRTLAERRQARAAANESYGGEARAELPECLSGTITRHSEEIRSICHSVLAEVRRSTDEAAESRMRAIEGATAARLTAMQEELDALHSEYEALAADLDEATATCLERQKAVESLSAALDSGRAMLTALEHETRQQLASLEEDVRRATAARVQAEERAHAAELAQAQAIRTSDLAQERLVLVTAERDTWRTAARREETRAREAERTSEERRVRLEMMEAERGRMQQELAQALGRLGVLEELRPHLPAALTGPGNGPQAGG